MGNALQVISPDSRAEVVRAEDFLPILSVAQAVERKAQVNQFISQVLKEGEDYGDIPGASKKKVLLKPGAEKLCSIFGLTPSYVKEVIVEDWTGSEHGGEPLFSYEYRCQLYRGGKFMGEAIGSCNSWESKYRYRWVNELLPGQIATATKGGRISEFTFAVEKAETGGKYGKPAEYWKRFKDGIEDGTAEAIDKKKKDGSTSRGWEIDSTMYRIPNPDVADIINTCMKMAQKRALVSAVLIVTNCSDAFTPDLEDFHEMEAPKPQPQQGYIDVDPQDNLPADIAALFTPKVAEGAVARAISFVRTRLLEVLDQEHVDAEYRDIMEHNGVKPGKGNSNTQVRNAVMQCYTRYNQLKAAQPKQTSLTDLPEGQGRDENWTDGRE